MRDIIRTPCNAHTEKFGIDPGNIGLLVERVGVTEEQLEHIAPTSTSDR